MGAGEAGAASCVPTGARLHWVSPGTESPAAQTAGEPVVQVMAMAPRLLATRREDPMFSYPWQYHAGKGLTPFSDV